MFQVLSAEDEFLSIAYLTREEAEQWLERHLSLAKQALEQPWIVALLRAMHSEKLEVLQMADIVEIPGDPPTQDFACTACGQLLPWYVVIEGDDGYDFYSCPRCGWEE